MSLVLKSNVVATNSIGNLSGINGRQDWSYFADFDNEQVRKRSGGTISYIQPTDILENIGSLNMAAKPVTYSKSGVESYIASPQALRFFPAQGGDYGLLVESAARTNIFVNSETPANQTINAAATARIVASVSGSGTLTLSSPNFSSDVVVTENNPQVITTVSSAAASDITATVSGVLTHAQVERIGNGIPVASGKITSGSGNAGSIRGLDKISLSQTVLDDLKTSPFVVLMKVVPKGLLVNSIQSKQAWNIFCAETAEKTNSTSIQVNSDLSAALRMAQHTPEAAAVNGNTLNLGLSGFTIAAKYDGTTLTTSVNGGNPTSAALSANTSTITSFLLASLGNYYAGSGSLLVIPKLALFKGDFDNKELQELSTSWT